LEYSYDRFKNKTNKMLVLALQFSRCECDACGTKRLNTAASRGNSLKTKEKTVDVVATLEQEGPNPYDHS